MKFGSVCSGIEAASVAWHPLGWKAAWLSEIEPFPSAVLKHHYPDVPNLGDMTRLPDLIAKGEVEAPDLFCGGTPCQAFSVAGLRRSLDDARGNLSLTFCEIADAIDTVRAARGEQPAIIFWENVPGVLNTKDNAFGCFLAGLAGEELPLLPPGGKWTNAGCVSGPQRAVAWRVLDAQYFGVAQRRRRVFVVASARNDFDPAAVLFEFDGVRRDTAPSREAGQGVAPCVTAGAANGGAAHGARSGSAKDNLIVPVAFGGNNQAGPIDVATARNACASASGRLDFETETFLVQPVTSSIDASYGRLQGCSGQDMNHGHSHLVPVAGAICRDSFSGGMGGKPEGAAAGHLLPVAFHPTQDPISSTDGSTHALGCGSSGGQASVAVALPINTQIATRHNALGEGTGFGIGDETDPAFTLTKGHSHAVATVAAFKGGQGSAAGGIGYDEHVAPTLSAADSGSKRTPALLTAMQVRRLTPVECERLQGFPDGYTAIPWRNKPADQCPDGPRYKALGNSWAVPNVRWIGARIQAALMKPANDNGQRAEVAA
jgi:DNA (cytosine-5)-methyltransferase 1